MLVELLYCSVSAVPKLANADLDQILASARWRNLAQDITGMMIYYRGEFVQILEGSKKSVQNVYDKFICPDPRLRISVIVDTCFRLIVDGVSEPSWTRRGCAQARG